MSALDEFAADVRAGLGRHGQKELPPRYLYDDLGSALFEAICLLPEYGLWRAGSRLLRRHATEIAENAQPPLRVVEMGSGSGGNTRVLLEALARRAPVTYHPIDVSDAAIRRCTEELRALADVEVRPIQDTFLPGLQRAARERVSADRLLVLFLGGTIGNFDRTAAARFIADVRRAILPGDLLLLAADLDKPASALLPAYDDALGVTAAFNRNVLVRINRELYGDFDPALFDHVARWDERERRIEMHLRSRVDQVAHVASDGLRVEFRAGETIWTESSYRFSESEIARMGEAAGFDRIVSWVDEEWPFVQTLLRAR